MLLKSLSCHAGRASLPEIPLLEPCEVTTPGVWEFDILATEKVKLSYEPPPTPKFGEILLETPRLSARKQCLSVLALTSRFTWKLPKEFWSQMYCYRSPSPLPQCSISLAKSKSVSLFLAHLLSLLSEAPMSNADGVQMVLVRINLRLYENLLLKYSNFKTFSPALPQWCIPQ